MRGCWKGTGMLVLLGIPAPCVQSLLSLASLSLVPLAFLPTCPHPCIPKLGVPTHGAGCEQGPCGGQGDKAQETEGPCRTLQASRRRSALQSNGTGHPSCGWDTEKAVPAWGPQTPQCSQGLPTRGAGLWAGVGSAGGEGVKGLCRRGRAAAAGWGSAGTQLASISSSAGTGRDALPGPAPALRPRRHRPQRPPDTAMAPGDTETPEDTGGD